jgi:hypothetical protein
MRASLKKDVTLIVSHDVIGKRRTSRIIALNYELDVRLMSKYFKMK